MAFSRPSSEQNYHTTDRSPILSLLLFKSQTNSIPTYRGAGVILFSPSPIFVQIPMQLNSYLWEGGLDVILFLHLYPSNPIQNQFLFTGWGSQSVSISIFVQIPKPTQFVLTGGLRSYCVSVFISTVCLIPLPA